CMFGSWFTGLLFSITRSLSRSLVLLVLAFAPLICLRFCELRHAFAHTASVGCDISIPADDGPADDGPADDGPADDGFIHDIQRLLSSLTEFILCAVVLVAARIIQAQPAHLEPRARTSQRRVPTPPPRMCCA
ncbi:MAG: hypothetical protein NTZ50_09030, partial [Chloroflexi bacterium]|nr:hypothetical protein [Chloroflexota bacterium]